MERARPRGRRPDQPAARVLGALAAAARPLHPHLRLRLGRELVRARPEAARRDDGVALGHARDDGPGRPVRDRGQVRAPGPAGDRARRRRRDADERPQRADHRRQVLAALDRPAPRRARAQQPRPEPGHVGAARAAGRPDVPGLAEDPRLPLRAVRRADRPARHPRRRPGPGRRRVGRRRSRPTARPCSRRSSTRRCRRCRRTSRFEQAKHFAQAVLAGDPHSGRMVRQSLRQMLDALIPGR